jgi:hypothetical protein
VKKTLNTYASPAAFRQALERRMRRQAEEEGVDLMRFRRQVAFDRLLARIFAEEGGPWALKGGYALELRFAEARTTRDIDLTLRTPAGLPSSNRLPTRLQEELQILADIDLVDFFQFAVAPTTMDIDAAPYGGARFPVDTRLAGRTFVKFNVDIGVGDALVEPVEVVTGRDWLDFAGIAAPMIICISNEQQFAEKLHAYTMPDRPHPNSRVKDLVDMVLMIQRSGLDIGQLRNAITVTFSRRAGHTMPETVPRPPEGWAQPFAALIGETGLEVDLEQAFTEMKEFLRKIWGA